MIIQKLENGLFVPVDVDTVRKTVGKKKPPKLVTHEKLGLQVQPSSYLSKRGFGHYDGGEGKYILIDVYRLEQKGLYYGFSIYGGDHQAWGHPPLYLPQFLTEEEAEEKLEYYKEHGHEDFT